MAESMRYEAFIISARDSSHKYTQQGVKLQNILRLSGPRPGAVTAMADSEADRAGAGHNIGLSA